MFVLPTPLEQEIVEEAISDSTRSDTQISYRLLIDDEDFSPYITSEEGEWGIDESGVCYCDLVLSTPLPKRLEGAPAEFGVIVNGVYIPQVTGVDSLSEIGEDRQSTDPFQARSAGGLANENTLDEDIDVRGWAPEQMIRKAASKLPYRRVRANKVADNPLFFTRAEGTHFTEDNHPSEMLQAVVDKAPYQYRDTYTNELVASASVPLGRGATAHRSYDARDIRGSGESMEGTGFRPPPRAEPRYSRVVVFRRNPDDSFAFKAIGKVNHRGNKYPPRNRTLYVELEDPTGDGPTRARTLASQLSSRAERGVHKDEMVLPSFDPLLERGDSFTVADTARELDGTYQRLWLCWVETIKKGIQDLLPVIGYSAMLAQESKIEAPTLALAGISSGIKRPPRLQPHVGLQPGAGLHPGDLN